MRPVALCFVNFALNFKVDAGFRDGEPRDLNDNLTPKQDGHYFPLSWQSSAWLTPYRFAARHAVTSEGSRRPCSMFRQHLRR